MSEPCGNCHIPGLIPDGLTADDCKVCDGTGVEKPDPCHWCGATDGYSTDYDGWPRCNSCQGC